VIGRVMSEYRDYKNREIKRFKDQKRRSEIEEPSQEMKDQIMEDAINRAKNRLSKDGSFESDRLYHHLYDYLVEERKQISFDASERKKYYKMAQMKEKTRLMNQAQMDFEIHRKIKRMIDEIDNKRNGRVIKLAKTMLIEKYLINQLNQNEL
jgi:hypothetical protein